MKNIKRPNNGAKNVKNAKDFFISFKMALRLHFLRSFRN